MGKLILINEKQLRKVIKHLNEDKEFVGTDKQKQDIVVANPKDFKAYVEAFEKLVADYNLCTLNEEEMLSEDILGTLKKVAKGVVLASMMVALGFSAEEAKAQTGKTPKSAYTIRFKKAIDNKCQDIGKDKIKTGTSKQAVTYYTRTSQPKFGGEPLTLAYTLKGKEYTPMSKKNFEKMHQRGVKFKPMSSVRRKQANAQHPKLTPFKTDTIVDF